MSTRTYVCPLRWSAAADAVLATISILNMTDASYALLTACDLEVGSGFPHGAQSGLVFQPKKSEPSLVVSGTIWSAGQG
jgi:hypothetical protein